MKTKIIIILSLILVISAVLLVPIPKESYDDGGTRVFEALTYKLVKWKRLQSEDVCYNSTRIYFGKDKNRSIDELWMMIDPPDDGESTDNKSDGEKIKFRAKALEVDKGYILVEPVEGSNELNSANKINIPKAAAGNIQINEGDMLEIEYDGMIAETYPALIEKVYSVKNLGIYN